MASFGKITQSGDLNFVDKPIPVITTAPLGSGKMGFPSAFRGTGAKVPIDMEVEELYGPLEKNGFTILDIGRDQVEFEIYSWRLPQTMEEIHALKPAFTSSIDRP